MTIPQKILPWVMTPGLGTCALKVFNHFWSTHKINNSHYFLAMGIKIQFCPNFFVTKTAKGEFKGFPKTAYW